MAEEIVPRYEFRAFASCLGQVAEAIRSRTACDQIEETLDIYLVTAVNHTYNIKLRADQLDIKEKLQVENGLELWRPKLKQDFPLTAVFLQAEVFPTLGVEAATLPPSVNLGQQLLTEIVWQNPFIRPAYVFKRRFHFSLADCMVEISQLRINGASMQSVAVEAEEKTAVLYTQELLGLQSFENVNYQLALQRIMGLSPLPEDSWQWRGMRA